MGESKIIIYYFLRCENKRRDLMAQQPGYRQDKYYDEHGDEIDSTFLDLTDVCYSR